MSELTNVAGAGQSVPASVREEVLAASSTNLGGGFGFENHHRNARIVAELSKSGKAGTLPRAKLTGTTICGCVFKGGVVLGADTRATGGTEVVDKNCEKIHYLAPNIYCCGAGTAADTEKTTEMISGQVGLFDFAAGTVNISHVCCSSGRAVFGLFLDRGTCARGRSGIFFLRCAGVCLRGLPYRVRACNGFVS